MAEPYTGLVVTTGVSFDSQQIHGLTCLTMVRFHTPKAITLLIVMLLLLPLQGHARMLNAEAAMPCTMEHHGMASAEAMMMGQADHPCDAGTPCKASCQDCGGCSHCPAGIAATLPPPGARFVPPVYAASSGAAYSSIVLFKDSPPPRNS